MSGMIHRLLSAAVWMAVFSGIRATGAETGGGSLKPSWTRADEVEIRAERVEYDAKTGQAHLLPGRNEVVYGPTVLSAREMWLNQETKDVRASGDVQIRLSDGTRWQSGELRGNLGTSLFSFGSFRLDGSVWHCGGGSGRNDADGTKTFSDAWLSTCDCPVPHYRLGASRIRHFPDQTFTAKHVVVRAGAVPVFWLPFVWGTTDNRSGWIFRPGYSGKRGAYLRLGRYGKPDEWTERETYVDLMSKRGIGLGHGMDRETGNSRMTMALYGILDSEPPESSPHIGWNRRFKEEHDRYRLHWYGRYDFTPAISLRANLDVLSDIDMLEDWFRGDYHRMRQPKNYVDWSMSGPWYEASVAVRPRLNDFYTVSEALPEVRFEVPRLSLGGGPLAYESETRAGYYRMSWRRFDRKRRSLFADEFPGWDEDGDEWLNEPSDYELFRADSRHFVYLPISAGGDVTVTPRAGFRATYYSASNARRITGREWSEMFRVDDPDSEGRRGRVLKGDRRGGEVLRLAYELGVEARTRRAGAWREVPWMPSAMRGMSLRHIAEPYVNATYSPEPSHESERLYYIDDTDWLERQRFVRIGLEQLWQTRPSDGSQPAETRVRWENYLDLHLNRWKEDGRRGGSYGSRLTVYPWKGFSFLGSLVHDLGSGSLSYAEAGAGYTVPEQVGVSVRYVRWRDRLSRMASSMGSHLTHYMGGGSWIRPYYEPAESIRGSLKYWLNSERSVEISVDYDLEKSRVSEHRYLWNQQLHCWVLSAGVGWDDGDFEVLLMLRLAAFPKVKIGLNL